MKRILTALAIILLVTACGDSVSLQGTSTPSPTPGDRDNRTSSSDLPQHTVKSNTSLAPKNGRRIEIHVRDGDLTKAECESLIQAYKKNAGPEGQVSVRKQNKNNELLPWCVDNMDAKGTFFNDYHFE